MTSDDDEPDDLEASDEIATAPNVAADSGDLLETLIPADIRHRYEIVSYRNAAVTLAHTRKAEFEELLQALRAFSLTTHMIRTAGGNESEVPKLLSSSLRPNGWHETIVQGDLVVTMKWKVETGKDRKGKAVFEKRAREFRREKFLDGHKIDYVKNKVAFDLEWNSKDQTFDRDLYAFNAFFLAGAIDVCVVLTRSG